MQPWIVRWRMWLIIWLLRRIDPSKAYGTAFFEALCRLTVSTAFEAVPLRETTDGTIEVYMTLRPEDESAYGGQWHCAGSVMRPKDTDSTVFERLEREVGGKLVNRRFVGIFDNPGEARGHFRSEVYICVFDGDNGAGRWFAINNLPDRTVAHHRDSIIPMAVRFFRETAS
jgi:hypothetical protein